MMLATSIASAFAGPQLSAGALALAGKGTLLSGSIFSGMAADAAAGGSLLSLLSEGLTLSSAGLSIFGSMQQSEAMQRDAEMKARSLELQSKDDELAAKQEELRGQQETNDLTAQMIRTISAQRMSAAANNLDFSFGTPASVAENTRDISEAQMSTSRNDAMLRALSRRRQSAERMLESSNVRLSSYSNSRAARLQGVGSAVAGVNNLVDRRVTRG